MSNIIEHSNIGNFFDKFGLTGYEILKTEDIDEISMAALKLMDLERKGIIKFEVGLGFEVLDKDINKLKIYSDKMVLKQINNGVLFLKDEDYLKTCIIDELSSAGFLKVLNDTNKKNISKKLFFSNYILIYGSVLFGFLSVFLKFKIIYLFLCFFIIATMLGIYNWRTKMIILECAGYLIEQEAIRYRKRIESVDVNKQFVVDYDELEKRKKYIMYKGGN